MKEKTPETANAFKFKEPETLAAGVYATAMLASHTREEFFLDFLATYSQPSRLAARVILHPAHTKRLLKTLNDNIEIYEKKFGAPPAPPKGEPPGTHHAGPSQVQDLYSKLTIPESVLSGAYANTVLIRHTKEEFILDFLVICHPNPVLAARVLVSPAHVHRIASVLQERVKVYEDSFGAMQEQPPAPEPPPDDEPPRTPRFSLS
jgi:hypothetical protein